MILALFTAVSLFAAESSDVRDILKKLDSYIEDSNRYVAAKNENIAAIQEELSKKGGQDYDLNYALFDEYKSFRFDSAYFMPAKPLNLPGNLRTKNRSSSHTMLKLSAICLPVCFLKPFTRCL